MRSTAPRSRTTVVSSPACGDGSHLRNSFDGSDSRMRCPPKITADRRRWRRPRQDGFPSPDKFVPSPEHTSLFSSRDGTSRAKHRSRLLAQCARVADILGPETETHKQGTFPASLTELRLPDTSTGAHAW